MTTTVTMAAADPTTITTTRLGRTTTCRSLSSLAGSFRIPRIQEQDLSPPPREPLLSSTAAADIKVTADTLYTVETTVVTISIMARITSMVVITNSRTTVTMINNTAQWLAVAAAVAVVVVVVAVAEAEEEVVGVAPRGLEGHTGWVVVTGVT